MKRIIKNLIIVLVFFCFTYSGDVDVLGKETTSITVKYMYEDVDLSGVEAYLYWVEDLTDTLPDEDTDLDYYANQLEEYIVVHGVKPEYTGSIGDDGSVQFDNLLDGYYLLIIEDAIVGDYVYYSNPTVIEAIEDVAVTTKIASLSMEYFPPDDIIYVKKFWENDEEAGIRPDSVVVYLYEDGVVVDSAVLSEENDWSYSWSVPSWNHTYGVYTSDVPEEYISTVYSSVLNYYEILSTYAEEDEDPPVEDAPLIEDPEPQEDEPLVEDNPEPQEDEPLLEDEPTVEEDIIPQTGVVSWPIPVLSALGLLSLSIGVVLYKRDVEHE